MKTLIVGGVAGGASCAARLRRLDEKMEIVIIEKSHYVSYANCGLPYYIGDVIKDEDDLSVQTPRSLFERFRLDVRTDSEVIKVDTDNKKVSIKNNDKVYEESYDYLVLAPGSTYRKLYPNEDELKHLKTVEDVKALKAVIEDEKKIAIIGGGFIGVELAENLGRIDREVVIYEYAPQILANLDKDMADIMMAELEAHGIKVITNARIKEIKKGHPYTITLEDGTSDEFDDVVIAAGVRANTDFLKDSKIKLDERGFIITDEHMMTNIAGVYAAGDAIVNPHFISHKLENVALAGPANKQGRIIADNIYGLNKTYDGSIGTSIIKVFDKVAASTGFNTLRLDRDGYDYQTIISHPNSHATYYPNAKTIHIKFFCDKKTKAILGAQAVGSDGVDKFIDTIATAIKLKAKATDLIKLESAYAPPFLSAKSPANYLGFIAENIDDGLEELILFADALKEGDIILDVRTDYEYDHGHIEGSIHISVDDLRDRIDELAKYKDQKLAVLCAVGIRAHIACQILRAHDFKVANITGGYTSVL